MKTYTCRKCGFSGLRQEVRKHLREEHLIKGKSKVSRAIGLIKESKEISALTANTISVDID